MDFRLLPNIFSILTLSLLPILVNAQSQAIVISCRKYKDFINTTEDAALLDPNKKAQNLFSFKKPAYIILQSAENEEVASIMRRIAKCEVEDFILTKVRTKKAREQFRQDFKILSQKLYKTNDGITIGITKAIIGSSNKLYVNSITLVDGDTYHNFADFGEHDFNISPYGAEKLEGYYKFYGEETENAGSMYYGKFSILFSPDKRILTYQLHK